MMTVLPWVVGVAAHLYTAWRTFKALKPRPGRELSTDVVVDSETDAVLRVWLCLAALAVADAWLRPLSSLVPFYDEARTGATVAVAFGGLQDKAYDMVLLPCVARVRTSVLPKMLRVCVRVCIHAWARLVAGWHALAAPALYTSDLSHWRVTLEESLVTVRAELEARKDTHAHTHTHTTADASAAAVPPAVAPTVAYRPAAVPAGNPASPDGPAPLLSDEDMDAMLGGSLRRRT